LSARDRSVVPDVLGGVGSVLMHLLNAANAFLSRPEEAIVDEINTHLHDIPALIEGEPWTVFAVRAKGRVQVQEYVVLRAVFKPGTEEWEEFHVKGVSLNRRRRAQTPHVHIPDLATLEAWKNESPRKLREVGSQIEPLLRRLTVIISNARG
jgi:hypothetical protein